MYAKYISISLYIYLHTDRLGSGSAVTDRSGEAVHVLGYMPYGETLLDLSHTHYETPYQFTGYEKDQETGLHYAEARYYDSRLSIFNSTDPMWHKYPHQSNYTYCNNNPLMYRDPTGRDGEITGSGTKEDPYIIHANYYYNKGELSDELKNGLNAAIREYNDREPIKIKSGYVKFDLSAQEVTDKYSSRMNDANSNLFGNESFFSVGNTVSVNYKDDDDALGRANSAGISINISSIDNFVKNGDFRKDLIQSTFFHEIGHNLGLDDGDNTMMMMPALKSANGSSLIDKSCFDKDGVKIIMQVANKGIRRESNGIKLGLLKYR